MPIDLNQKIQEFGDNADRVDQWVNDPVGYTDKNGNPVDSIPKLIEDLNVGVQATAAGVARDEAEEQAGIATEQAAVATTQRVAAEAARDAAELFAGIYDTTAAGLAATTSGDYFSVPRAAPNEVFLDLYKNNAGVALLVNSYASSYLFDLTYGELSGWAYVLTDQNNNIAFGVKLDGSVTIGNIDDVESRLDLVVESNSEYERSGFVYALIDSLNRVAFGVAPDGDLFFQGQWLSNILETSAQPQIDALDVRVDSAEAKLTTGQNIVCWGDSLTAGAGTVPGGAESYPTRLATLLGRTVSNLGIGGQNANQIIARQGGRCALATISGNEVPASGGVTVTFGSTVPIALDGSIAGSFAGVPGTLVLSSGVYTFTRTTAGSAVKAYSLTPFIPDVALFEDRIAIFWIGRNNGWNTTDSAAIDAVIETVFNAVENGIRRLAQLEKRFLILGVTAVDTANEYVGTVSFDGKRTLAGMFAEKYPTQFIDIDRILNDSGTGTGQDAIDRDNGVIPVSIRSDPTHLNAAGYLLVAEKIRDRILLNGW